MKDEQKKLNNEELNNEQKNDLPAKAEEQQKEGFFVKAGRKIGGAMGKVKVKQVAAGFIAGAAATVGVLYALANKKAGDDEEYDAEEHVDASASEE